MALDASRLFCRFLSFSLSIHISHDTKGPIQMTNCLTDRATDHGMDGQPRAGRPPGDRAGDGRGRGLLGRRSPVCPGFFGFSEGAAARRLFVKQRKWLGLGLADSKPYSTNSRFPRLTGLAARGPGYRLINLREEYFGHRLRLRW